MDVSIVIPVDGRFTFLARSLETLLRQHALQSTLRAEILIIDNARADEARYNTLQTCRDVGRRHFPSRPLLRYQAARHPDPRHRNASYPLNVGIQQATAPIILISAADILHVTDTVRQHVEAHRGRDKLLLFSFCRDCPPDLSLDADVLEQATHDPRMPLRMASHVNWYGGMCCSAKRRHLLEIGGFEESFCRWGYEDYDLARRLRLMGCTVVRDDAIRVLHQRHPPAGRTGWDMKIYAGLRQMLRVRGADRGRAWGQTPHAPEWVA